jgi:hypothetical protein
MRKSFLTAIALFALLVVATSAFALEKTWAPADQADDWNASVTNTIAYYNNCIGWVIGFYNWSPGESFGVNYDTGPCDIRALNMSTFVTLGGAPSGYGFTGTIEVTDGGASACGATQLASQPWLPPFTAGLFAYQHSWGGMLIPQNFSVNVINGQTAVSLNPTRIYFDNPGAGPTGPAACGNCYPSPRPSNTKYYGVGGAFCPGTAIYASGTCEAEAYAWVQVQCTISVESQSWGQIKNLYK